jgi:DNA-binding transcriptional regulator YiaG
MTHYNKSHMQFTILHKQAPRWTTLIKQERTRLKLTQKDFGFQFGVTGQAVALWESGVNEPSSTVCWYLYRQLEQRYKITKQK